MYDCRELDDMYCCKHYKSMTVCKECPYSPEVCDEDYDKEVMSHVSDMHSEDKRQG